MDIKVRDLDVLTVKKIDALAKKQNMSRESFLRNYLNRLANEDLQKIEQNRFENLLKKNHDILENSISGQNKLIEKLNTLESILMIVLDIDLTEFNKTIEIWEGDNESGNF